MNKTIMVYLGLVVAFVIIYLFGMCIIAAKDVFLNGYELINV